jgi:hypothetical protein
MNVSLRTPDIIIALCSIAMLVFTLPGIFGEPQFRRADVINRPGAGFAPSFGLPCTRSVTSLIASLQLHDPIVPIAVIPRHIPVDRYTKMLYPIYPRSLPAEEETLPLAVQPSIVLK